jgi:hypothetical protein
MLDLKHAMTRHIFNASSLIDGVLVRGQQMSVSPSPVRIQLLAECIPDLDALRQLNAAQFGRSKSISDAIDECEHGLRQLAGLGNGQIVEDHRDGCGSCPVCGTAITTTRIFVSCCAVGALTCSCL